MVADPIIPDTPPPAQFTALPTDQPFFRKLLLCWWGGCATFNANDDENIWVQCLRCGKRAGIWSKESFYAYFEAEKTRREFEATRAPDGSGKAGEKTSNTIPRRKRVDLLTPAELLLRDAMHAVDQLGADPLLTEAIEMLDQVREKVADYIDRDRTCSACGRPLPPGQRREGQHS